MNRQDDRQSLAHALFKLRIANQTNRLRFGFMIIIGCTIAMALILPLLILDKTMIAMLPVMEGYHYRCGSPTNTPMP